MLNTNYNPESINTTAVFDYTLKGKKDVLTDFAESCFRNEASATRLFNSIQLNTIGGFVALIWKGVAQGKDKKSIRESLETLFVSVYTKEGADLPNKRNLQRKIQVAYHVFKKMPTQVDHHTQPHAFITEIVNFLSKYKDYTSLYSEMEEANRKTPRESSEADKINRAIDSLFAKIAECNEADRAGYLRIIKSKLTEAEADSQADSEAEAV